MVALWTGNAVALGVVAAAAHTVLPWTDLAGTAAEADTRRAIGLIIVGCAAWLAVQVLVLLEKHAYVRLPVDVADNRRIRQARTRVTVIRRIAGLQLAFAGALRIDDVVVVEGEWGKIEEITLTYVVVAIWDERRLALPTLYFTTTPFQNWTRQESRVLGAVELHLDYRTPLPELRELTQKIIEANPLWDRRDWVLQVTGSTPTTMIVRIVASAFDAPTAWDLRCDIREQVLTWLQREHPQSLPAFRLLQ